MRLIPYAIQGGKNLFIHLKIEVHFQTVYEDNSKTLLLRSRTRCMFLTAGLTLPVHTPGLHRPGMFENQPLSLWTLLTYPLLPYPPQTFTGDTLGEFIPPGATLAGVPSTTLGAGPSDSRDTDGFTQGTHLLLELQQSERKGKQPMRMCAGQISPFLSRFCVSTAVTNVFFEGYSSLPHDVDLSHTQKLKWCDARSLNIIHRMCHWLCPAWPHLVLSLEF